jgi:hypothetical protein
MPSVGLEPTIPAFERAKTVHAFGRLPSKTAEQVHKIQFCLVLHGSDIQGRAD